MKQYTITKKIAKHGSQAIIVIPRILEKDLKPGTIAKITIDVLGEINKDV
jgi:predicted RNA binding protein YcfA (HicA-like mRNA interferase family)